MKVLTSLLALITLLVLVGCSGDSGSGTGTVDTNKPPVSTNK